tara:strand:- start:144 stop:1013 length:870 start_codon:yes stop_codon:yes gene_type:complete
MKKSLLILGASGYLGSFLKLYFKNSGYVVVAHSHSSNEDVTFDASNYSELNAALIDYSPQILINATGYTDVDGCESNPNQAYLVNAKIVDNIAKSIEVNRLDTHFIHISTDHVYDKKEGSFEDEIVLQNYYAYSKFLGDIFASRIDSTVLRTNFFGNNPKFKEKGFTGWIMKSLDSQKKINGFDDIYFNPLSLDTLADLINQVIKVKPFGIFNLGSLEGMSKLEFIYIFATKLGYSKDLIDAIPFTKGDKVQAKRPMSMIMNCKKIQNKLNIILPTLSEEIDKVSKSYL